MSHELDLDEDLKLLLTQLKRLHYKLREHTKKKYKRINPFAEDLFDWKEKGAFWGGKNVTVYDSTTISGDVTIGDHTWIGPFCSIDGSGGLKIGRYCSISAGTQILTHDTVKFSLSGGKCEYEYAPVTIGDCCFLGIHSIILKGVKLGKHCLVGANSLVNRSFGDYSIIAGVPAKKIGEVRVEKDDVELIYFNRSDSNKSSR